MASLWWKRGALGLLLLVVPWLASAQSTLTNGSIVVVETINYCTDVGSTDAYACSHPAEAQLTTYKTGHRQTFIAATANTGAATLALDGLSAIPLKVRAGSTKIDPPTGTICAGSKVEAVYDGTDFEIVSLPCSPVITAGNATAIKTLLSLENVANTADASKAVATAAALAANGANCTVAGTFPNGVDAAGVAENCAALSASLPKTATYQVVVADFNTYSTIPVASGTFTITLPAAATQPSNGKYIRVLNYGTGVVTIARTDTNLNGGTASIVLPAGSASAPTGITVFSDGTNYFAQPYGAGGGVTDGDKGDITVSASGATWTIDAAAVTLAKMANMATASLLGRSTAGTGVPEVLSQATARTVLGISPQPIRPYSAIPVTAGFVFATIIDGDEMLGVTDATTLTTDAIWRLGFEMPPVLEGGCTYKLQLDMKANAATGVMRINPKWNTWAPGVTRTSLTLNAETVTPDSVTGAAGSGDTVTLGTGDANQLIRIKWTLNASTVTAAQRIAMDLTFENASTTLAVTSGYLPSIICE
jgi:hypothetical protein